MSANDKQIIYTALDLKRYHSGEMSDMEMHALEKAAMEDPFLADALDGYPNTNDFEADIADIKNKLFAAKESKKVIPLFSLVTGKWLKIAAIFILMAATAYFAWQFNNSNKEQPIAKTEQVSQDKSTFKKMEVPVINDSPFANKAETSTSSPNTLNKANQEANGHQGNVSIENSSLKNNANSEDKTLDYSTDKAASRALEMADEKKENKDAADVTKAAAAPIARNGLSKETTKYNLKGKVIDDSGNPVPFAIIKEKNGNTSVDADAEGKFSFNTNDSVAATSIAAVGYASRDQQLRDGEDQTIVLKQSSQELSEVVVTGMSRKKKKPTSAAGSVVNREELGQATTVGGMQLFNKYIKDSLKVPGFTDTEKSTGPVILSFKIKRDGTPYKIRVQQSLCDACDKEAIRLLIKGPRWIYLNEKRNTVSIDF